MFLTEERRSSHAILCFVVKILLFYHPLSVSMCLLLVSVTFSNMAEQSRAVDASWKFSIICVETLGFLVSYGTTDWVIESKYSKLKDHNQNRIESKGI